MAHIESQVSQPGADHVHVARHRLGQMAGELLVQLMAEPTSVPMPWQLPTRFIGHDLCGAIPAN